MTLAEFKTIFWWEWSHRLLGRAIGVVFLLPFLFFLWRGGLSGAVRRRLSVIFGLGALQGVVGWWMVASGLTQRIEVSQYRLAAHLMLALVIFSAILWTLLRLPATQRPVSNVRLRAVGIVLLVLTFVQIYFGALVAGLRAGRVYNTWPTIDGAFVPDPSRLFFEAPWWRNFFDNALTVQFSHRMTAYVLLFLVLAHLADAVMSRAPKAVVRSAAFFAMAVALQATLGVATLLYAAPIDLALTHQAMALIVLTLAILHVDRLTPRGAVVQPLVLMGAHRPA